MTSGPCQQQSNLAAQSPERQGHPAMRHKRLNRPNKQNTVIAAVAIQRLEAAEVQAVWRRQGEVTRQRNAKESGEMESAKKEVSENERWREEAAVAEKRNAGRSNETKKQQEGRKLKKAIGKKGEERKKEAEEKKAEATTDLMVNSTYQCQGNKLCQPGFNMAVEAVSLMETTCTTKPFFKWRSSENTAVFHQYNGIRGPNNIRNLEKDNKLEEFGKGK
uniref:Uncharacterized protein n=1 Tax=Globodera rostochiensis TaxID=31243 RepID=A0A914H5K3_GLORO